MKKIAMMILMTILMTSCGNFTDNTGKCYKAESERYTTSFTYLVFNEKDDYVFFSDNQIYGPNNNMFLGDKHEITCPKETSDAYAIITKKLKKYGVYNDVTKHITIHITN